MGKSRFLQTLALLGAAHFVCTTIGLWWLHRATCKTLRDGLQEQILADLELRTRGMVGSSQPPQLENLKRQLELANEVTADRSYGEVGFILMDTDWHPIGLKPRSEETVSARWNPATQYAPGADGARRGILTFPAGRHIALAYPLGANTGYLVGHVPEALVPMKLAELAESLPLLTLLTLFWTCIPVGIIVYMIAQRCKGAMDRERQLAQAEALRQTSELVRTRDAIIVGLAKLAESRDPETGDHLERLATYSTLLAAALAEHPRFSERITPTFIKLIGISSVLHDIGKVGIPDSILLKRGPLTDSERAVMQHHSGIGGRCLREIERKMGSSSYLQMAREIAFYHHERWDGGGYPDGLSGEDIPLAARIVALADVYDALSATRSYKGPLLHEQCVDIIRRDRGCQFDPDIVDVWLTVEPEYQTIVRRYATTGSPLAEPSRPDADTPEVELQLSATGDR